MDIYDRRRENLRAYRDYLGSDTTLSEKLNRSLSQVGQIIGPNPLRNIGQKLVRDIEVALKLPKESLDSPTADLFMQAIALERLESSNFDVQIVTLPIRRDGTLSYDGQNTRYPNRIFKVSQDDITIDVTISVNAREWQPEEKHKQGNSRIWINTIFQCEKIVEVVADEIRQTINMQELIGIRQLQEAHKQYNVSPAPETKGQVPLISWVQAGDWNGSGSDDLEYEPERWMDCPRAHSKRTFALRVKGDSMQSSSGKSYPDGSIIYVDAEMKDPVSGDRVVARLRDSNEATFKVFMKEEGQIWLRPLNPGYPIINDQFEIIGTVIGKWEDE